MALLVRRLWFIVGIFPRGCGTFEKLQSSDGYQLEVFTSWSLERPCAPLAGTLPGFPFPEQITIRYLLAEIISTRTLGAGREMCPTEPHLLRSRASC